MAKINVVTDFCFTGLEGHASTVEWLHSLLVSISSTGDGTTFLLHPSGSPEKWMGDRHPNPKVYHENGCSWDVLLLVRWSPTAALV